MDDPSSTVIRRHALATRIWHWVTAISVIILLGSGLMILNAHGQLYWGEYGANFDRPWFKLIWFFDTARVPGWLTIPSTYNLALARRWHLFFALVLGFALLAYMIVSLLNRHFQRDLRIRWSDLSRGHLRADLKAHWALRFHDPENPRAYNIFQKASYAAVIFVLLPLVIFTGLAMSPGMNAAWPWLLDVFGGRQSARSIHFIVAMLLALFIIVHLTLVILAGPVNEVRSMLTGKWRVPPEDAP
ncbi:MULTISPECIES: cytochrome b/b6 domain-containing protein [unclassified Sphingomonas]|uniref:cytochrome b/b6 domain-containing protein n=1 Tax=unclassified Sphingomonas TaxID=196159 RepID=UPI002151902F|nr:MULTISPECIES: cytochrome b/b6 domain-containing protein [unclassified Sphingomonas]MCR5869827.1 cytochrome b/b6 domain-containing protein [Sphingomonas sp. J344]UUX98472.1 cytochrome b/b6 domain-containing protein [Sphingomonas sp. J315]